MRYIFGEVKKGLRTILQYVFFLGLGIFLVWWSIKDLSAADRSEIRTAVRHARYFLIIPVFFILIMSHFIRAMRWRLLIRSLGYNPSLLNSFFAVLIGYLANQAVPRLGEVLKCTVLSRYEKVPADKLIGTIILERLIDALTLLLVFGITLVIQPDLYNELMQTFFHSGDPHAKKSPPYLIAGIIGGVLLIALIIWMIVKKKKIADLYTILIRIKNSVWQGISAIQHLKERWLFIILTVILWSLYLSGGYIGFLALHETQQYGVTEAFSILSAGSVGMIVTPGGIGAYALLIEKTMQVYGLSKGVALAFGWLLWLAQTGVILVGGLFSFIALPAYNKRRQNHSKDII